MVAHYRVCVCVSVFVYLYVGVSGQSGINTTKPKSRKEKNILGPRDSNFNRSHSEGPVKEKHGTGLVLLLECGKLTPGQCHPESLVQCSFKTLGSKETLSQELGSHRNVFMIGQVQNL